MIYDQLHDPLLKAGMAAPAALGLLLMQGTSAIPDAPPWALQYGILGILLFFGGLFFWTQYWPWVKQCKIEDDKTVAAREQYERDARKEQWSAFERMNATFSESVKALAAAIQASKPQ